MQVPSLPCMKMGRAEKMRLETEKEPSGELAPAASSPQPEIITTRSCHPHSIATPRKASSFIVACSRT